MNFLQKLLDRAKVEWLPLGDVGEFIRGNGLQKKDFVEDGFPAIHYGQIYTKYGLCADKTFTYIAPELAHRLRKAQKNDLLLATTSENDEDVVKPLAWLGGQVAISGDMMLFRHEQNVKYLAYFFQTEDFQKQKRNYITGTKVRRVSSQDLAKIKIPLPCPENPQKSLKIQTEIAQILDKLTASTRELQIELERELELRKKQYAFYRDKLLTFPPDGAVWKTLEEVTTHISAGGDLPEKYMKGQTQPNEEFPYPIYSNGIDKKSLYGFTNEYKIDAEAVTISARGTIGWYTIRQAKFTPIVRLIVLIPDTKIVTAKFLNYVLDMTEIGHSGGSIPQLTLPNVKRIKIPAPSLEEQGRIVAILDRFETLTNSLQEGLPREITLRKKQYEYYRDMLFAFPKD